MDEVQSNLTNISKRSWVWNHFTFNENTKKAQCNYCQALIAINRGSTSGMSGHIKSKHKITKEKRFSSSQARKPSLSSFPSSSGPVPAARRVRAGSPIPATTDHRPSPSWLKGKNIPR